MAVKRVVACALLAITQATALNVDGFDELIRGTAKKAACSCLSWTEVYYEYKAFCGRGNELYFLSKHGYAAAYAATEPIAGVPHKVCYDFFKNFITPSCLNIDLYPFDAKRAVHDVNPFPADNRTGKQWCYVSNDCEDLNGGGYATNHAGFAHGAWSNLESTPTQAWKICKPGAGGGWESLADWPVTNVIEAGEYSDVSMSRLFRLAYPAVEISWGEAHYFMEEVNKNYQSGRSLAQMVDLVSNVSSVWGARISAVHAELRILVKSGRAYVLDSVGHGENFHVIEGRAAYSVTRLAPPMGDMAYLGGHFFREYAVECVMGCAMRREAKHDTVDLDTM